MDIFESLNSVLVDLFNDILNIEERALITEEFKDISVTDMHIIEAIGIDEPRMMSAIAARLSVTTGTLTSNMSHLEAKQYIHRERSQADKRVVLVTLTDRGRKAFFHHRDFHRSMIRAIVRNLDEEETKTLIKCLSSLKIFLEEKRKWDN